MSCQWQATRKSIGWRGNACLDTRGDQAATGRLACDTCDKRKANGRAAPVQALRIATTTALRAKGEVGHVRERSTAAYLLFALAGRAFSTVNATLRSTSTPTQPVLRTWTITCAGVGVGLA